MKNFKYYTSAFSEMKKEWKWISGYIVRYKFYIFVYILMSVVGTVVSLSSGISVKYLIDAVVSHLDSVIFKYAAFTVAFAVLNLVFRGISSWIAAKTGTKVNNEIRADVYERMISAKWEGINKYHSGDLVNRIEGDVSAVSSGVTNFVPAFITNSLQFIGSLTIVLYYDKTMALLSLMSAPFLVLSSDILMKKIRSFNKESRQLNGRILSYTGESMQNIRVIKSFDLTKRYADNFTALLAEYRNVKLKYHKFSILITFIISVIGLIVSYSCYGWGVYRLWKGAITYGTMTLFLQLSGSLTSSFGAVASMASGAVTTATSAGRIIEITGFEKEKDKDSHIAVRMLQEAEKTGLRIRFDNVGFRYSDADNFVLRNVSFELKSGETVAITGPSGEGKTTALNLLLGIITPTDGSISIITGSDNNLRVSDSTRRFFSYVPQEFGIFSGTVAENLRLGKADATDEEIINALKQAEIYDYISTLPDGINTTVSEQASNFSKGQAQRIITARALLRDTPVILMDEATSALDVETEERVIDNIMRPGKNRLCVITSHRESVLKHCDKILRIEPDGSVSEVTGDYKN